MKDFRCRSILLVKKWKMVSAQIPITALDTEKIVIYSDRVNCES